MQERITAVMSRREFINRSFALLLTPLFVPQSEILYPQERITKHRVEATRHELDLTYATDFDVPPAIDRYIKHLNETTIDSQSNHETPSPDVLEGWYTTFGPSSISDQQMLIVTDELQRRIKSGEISLSSMTNQEAVLYKIRQTYDQMELYSDIHDPELYKSNYIQMLRRALLPNNVALPIAVAAGRSINDMGRVGFVQTYNKLSEAWSPPVLVVVLNTANAQTYWGNINSEMVHTDETSEYDATMRWSIELSDEALIHVDEKSRINRRPGVVRYFDVDLPDSIQIHFPTYRRLAEPMTDSWKQIGYDISRALRTKSVHAKLSEILSTHTLPSWEFIVGDVKRTQEVQGFNFLPYLIATLTQHQVFEGDDQQFMHALSQEQTTPGIPIGNITLHSFLTRLFINAALNREIMTAPPSSTSFFFLENYDQTRAIFINGIYDQQSKRFIYIQDNTVVFKTYAQITEIKSQSPMNRIILFR